MSRHLTFTLFCGSLAAAIVLWIAEWNGFFDADGMTANLLSGFGGVFKADDLPRSLPLQYAVHTTLAFAGAWLTFCVRPAAWQSLLLVGTLILLFILPATLALFGILFEPFSGAAALMLGVLLALLAGRLGGQGRLDHLRQAFAGRLSETRIQTILERAPDEPFLPAQRECSILVCRILNFNLLENFLDGPRLVEITDRFHQELNLRLIEGGALVDMMAEGMVRAVFGVPETGESPAPRAVRLAMELQPWMRDFAAEVAGGAEGRPQLGLAMVTDSVTAGLWGEGEDAGYHLVSSATERAAALAELNAEYGSLVLLDGRTLQLAQEMTEARPLDMIQTNRQQPPGEIYELLGLKGAVAGEPLRRRDEFWAGVLLLREGKATEAQQAFARAVPPDGKDAVLSYFQARAAHALGQVVLPSAGQGPLPAVETRSVPEAKTISSLTATPVTSTVEVSGAKPVTRVLIAKS